MEALSCICDCADETKSPLINYFCYTQDCKLLSRRCCPDCKDKHAELNHSLIELGKQKALSSLSNRSSLQRRPTITMKVTNTLQRIDKISKKLIQSCNELIFKLTNSVNQHLKKPLEWIQKSLGQQLKNQARQTIYQRQSSRQDLEQIGKLLRCLNEEKTSKAEEIDEVCDNIQDEFFQIPTQIQNIMDGLLDKIKRLDPLDDVWKQDKLNRQSSRQSLELPKSAFEKKQSILENQSLSKFNNGKIPSQIKQIQMNSRFFESIPQELGLQTRIIKLSLTNNKISKINNLDSFEILEQLNLSYNLIERIQNLDKLQFLKDLRFNGNRISVIENLSHLINLQLLSLQQNRIKKMQNLQKLYNLCVLQLGNNQIQVVQGLENCKSLVYISLYFNQIQDFYNFDSFPKLKDLYLANNPLRYNSEDQTIIDNLQQREVNLHQIDDWFE